MTTATLPGPFVAVPQWAIAKIAAEGRPIYTHILTVMVSEMHRGTQTVTRTQKQLAAKAGLAQSPVTRALKWMCDNCLITSMGPGPNQTVTYRINYAPPLVSRDYTPRLTGLGGVVSPDYGQSDVSPGQEADSNRDRVMKEVGIENDRYTFGAGCARQDPTTEGEAVIFGVDPDEAELAPVVPVRKPGSPVPGLVNHFVHHQRVVMKTRFSPQDLMILRKTMKSLVMAGLSRESVMTMIDKFMSNDRFVEAASPAKLFASKSVQAELASTMEVKVQVDDEVLSLMLTDFHRDGHTLPWPAEADRDLERAIISHGINACYRYPELVSALAHQFPGDFTSAPFTSALQTLDDLVLGLSSNAAPDTLAQHLTELTALITLPAELRALNANALRPASRTLADAIYAYKRTPAA